MLHLLSFVKKTLNQDNARFPIEKNAFFSFSFSFFFFLWSVNMFYYLTFLSFCFLFILTWLMACVGSEKCCKIVLPKKKKNKYIENCITNSLIAFIWILLSGSILIIEVTKQHWRYYLNGQFFDNVITIIRKTFYVN